MKYGGFMKAQNIISFRPEASIKGLIDKWLRKNPSINRTALINMALAKFTTEEQHLDPVVVEASSSKTMSEAKKALKEHRRAIDELQ